MKSLFTEDMVVYVENSQRPRKPLLKLMSELNKVIGDKVIYKTQWYFYILSCLFYLYAEYIMRNAGLEGAQAVIKIAGRNINNLR